MTRRVLYLFIGLSGAIPAVAIPTAKAMAATAKSDCSCSTHCSPASRNCTILVCSDGSTQYCTGWYVN